MAKNSDSLPDPAKVQQAIEKVERERKEAERQRLLAEAQKRAEKGKK